ncbi:DMT family transporter [Actinomadura sp. DC4]|uniref:EamA family transporter n=1 Tax=Actinomadura sp. DC4 TaxID=3055069 RepID=UPI0025AED269|nr:DMT family transporter [Actinomadura sp. DC4]MDN3356188.1 DMT family transporter [Actinomadura sp. DC4]
MNAVRLKAWGLGFGVFSSVAFGTSGSFGKALIGAGLSPLQASWVRVAAAALVLLPVALVLRPRATALAVRHHWRLLVPLGLVGVAGCQTFYFVAASRLPVGVAILLEFTGPVLVVGWTRFVLRTPLPRSAALGVAIALAGLTCVVEVWSGLRLDLLGVLAGLAAAACQAAFFLLADRASGRIDPLVMTAGGFAVGAVTMALVVPPWHVPWHVIGGNVAFGDHTAPGWLLLTLLVLVSTVIAYVASVAAVHRLSAPIAGAVGYVEAVAASVFAWLTLGEHLSPVQIAGGVIVLAGAFVAQRSVAAREPVPGEVLVVEPAVVTRAGG